jgi:hypothetical protein
MDLRLYTFVNSYLSSIQKGIQTAHIVHELILQYGSGDRHPSQMVYDWAAKHKTIIVLNGGNNESLHTINSTLAKTYKTYPYTSFNEDDQSLGGIMTAVGVVLPESVFACRPAYDALGFSIFYRPDKTQVIRGDYEYELIELVTGRGLAS